MIDFNYAKLDLSLKYHYKEDRLSHAYKYGFKYISQMTVELYRQHKSINKVAKIIGISFSSVQTELKKIGEPVQGRGGYRIGDKRYGGKCRRDY